MFIGIFSLYYLILSLPSYLLNKRSNLNRKKFHRRDAKDAEENQYLSTKIGFFVFRPLSEKQKQVGLCVLGVSAVKIKLHNFISSIF